MDNDNGGWAIYLLAAIVITLLVILICGCERVTPTDRANGMPLDACTVVEYDRPAWLPYCSHAYKVYDRQTGDAWWLLVMSEGSESENYIVLPLDEADR
jgi:hypothetical protein